MASVNGLVLDINLLHWLVNASSQCSLLQQVCMLQMRFDIFLLGCFFSLCSEVSVGYPLTSTRLSIKANMNKTVCPKQLFLLFNDGMVEHEMAMQQPFGAVLLFGLPSFNGQFDEKLLMLPNSSVW